MRTLVLSFAACLGALALGATACGSEADVSDPQDQGVVTSSALESDATSFVCICRVPPGQSENAADCAPNNCGGGYCRPTACDPGAGQYTVCFLCILAAQ